MYRHVHHPPFAAPSAAAIALCAAVSLTVAGACSERVTDPTAASIRPAAQVVFDGSLATLAWQQTARDLVLKYRNDPLAATRVYGLLSVARYAGIVAASEGGGRRELEADHGSIAGASAAILTYLFPLESGFLEGLVDAQRDEQPGQPHPHFERGEAMGRATAAIVIERARTDGFAAPWAGQIPTGAGLWVGTAPVQPLLGSMLPFNLTSGSQFRPGPPPLFGSPEYQAALAEVRQISDTRTATQLAIAQFWAMRAGTITSQGYWDQRAAGLIVAAGFDELEAAHFLAVLDAAAVDAAIACWDAKYTYWYIRPSQADPAITLPIGLPGHPSWPSGHSCVSGSSSEILAQRFPSESAQVAEEAIEAGRSRVYAGIHFQFDSDAGLALGRAVGRYALEVDRLRGVLSALN